MAILVLALDKENKYMSQQTTNRETDQSINVPWHKGPYISQGAKGSKNLWSKSDIVSMIDLFTIIFKKCRNIKL